MKKILVLVFFIIISFCAGFFGTLFSGNQAFIIYQSLNLPSFSPPGWIFGPVWSLLYLMMGISAFFIWAESKNKKTKKALSMFFIQLILNTAWTPIFFGLGERLFAFFVIIFLWASILLTIIYFYKINKLSAYLLIPYLLWVSFAAVLNFAVWSLNI